MANLSEAIYAGNGAAFLNVAPKPVADAGRPARFSGYVGAAPAGGGDGRLRYRIRNRP
jgi:hypothetical protein